MFIWVFGFVDCASCFCVGDALTFFMIGVLDVCWVFGVLAFWIVVCVAFIIVGCVCLGAWVC